MTIWYNIWPIRIVCGHLIYFFRFGMFGPRKIWQPLACHLKDVAFKVSLRLCVFECYIDLRVIKLFPDYFFGGGVDECILRVVELSSKK
jgi:hypothetical protein